MCEVKYTPQYLKETDKVKALATDEDIKRTILRKMLRATYIGGRHTSIDNLPKGFPKSDVGHVKKVVDKMVKDGYFILHNKPDSLHVALNPSVIAAIKKEIKSG